MSYNECKISYGGFIMALVKCPECGRERVSDSAEACPDCGYRIKAHFDKIKYEEAKREQIKRLEEKKKLAEIEAKKRQEERIKSVPQLEKPQLEKPIAIFAISFLSLLTGIILSISAKEADRSIAHEIENLLFCGVFLIIIGICLVCYGAYTFSKCMKRYNLSKNNLEEYQRQVIKEQDAAIAAAQAASAARARAEAQPECPYCHSYNTTKITTTAKVVNTAMFGILGQKRRYQWLCNNCKSYF